MCLLYLWYPLPLHHSFLFSLRVTSCPKHFWHHCSTDGTQHERNYPVAPAPMPGSPIQLLTDYALIKFATMAWHTTRCCKASSYSEAVCVFFIPVVPITTTPLPPFFFRSQELSLHELGKHFWHHCSTDGTQHERNYPVAPAPMPGSPIQLLTELCVA